MYCYLTDWSGGIYATPTMSCPESRTPSRKMVLLGMYTYLGPLSHIKSFLNQVLAIYLLQNCVSTVVSPFLVGILVNIHLASLGYLIRLSWSTISEVTRRWQSDGCTFGYEVDYCDLMSMRNIPFFETCPHMSTYYMFASHLLKLSEDPKNTYQLEPQQGGGGCFKDRKPTGEVRCCESWMAEQTYWWIERWLERRPIYLSIYLPV